MNYFRRSRRGRNECAAGAYYVRLSVLCADIDRHVAGEGNETAGFKIIYHFELFFLFHAAQVDFVYALGG